MGRGTTFPSELRAARVDKPRKEEAEVAGIMLLGKERRRMRLTLPQTHSHAQLRSHLADFLDAYIFCPQIEDPERSHPLTNTSARSGLLRQSDSS